MQLRVEDSMGTLCLGHLIVIYCNKKFPNSQRRGVSITFCQQKYSYLMVVKLDSL